jgi:ABC-type transporter Mla subunit MlaD
MANMGMDYEAAQGLMGALMDDLALIAQVETNLNEILLSLTPEVFEGKAAEVVRQRLQQIIKALQNNRQAWEELVKRGNDTISEFESQDQQLKSANPIQV